MRNQNPKILGTKRNRNDSENEEESDEQQLATAPKPLNEGTYMNKARIMLERLPQRPDDYSVYIKKNWGARGSTLQQNPRVVTEVYNYQVTCHDLCIKKAQAAWNKAKETNRHAPRDQYYESWLDDWSKMLTTQKTWLTAELINQQSKKIPITQLSEDEQKNVTIEQGRNKSKRATTTTNSKILDKGSKVQKIEDAQLINQRNDENQLNNREIEVAPYVKRHFHFNFETLNNLIAAMKFSDTHVAVGFSQEYEQEQGQVEVKHYSFYMIKQITTEFEPDQLDVVLSQFVNSTLNATCIVILSELEIDRGDLRAWLENQKYFGASLTNLCLLLKDPNDPPDVSFSEFYFPRVLSPFQFRLMRKQKNFKIVENAAMSCSIMFREGTAVDFYMSYLNADQVQFQQADIITTLVRLSRHHASFEYEDFGSHPEKQKKQLYQILSENLNVNSVSYDALQQKKLSQDLQEYERAVFFAKLISDISSEVSQKNSKNRILAVQGNNNQIQELGNFNRNQGTTFSNNSQPFRQNLNNVNNVNNVELNEDMEQDFSRNFASAEYTYNTLETCLKRIESIRSTALFQKSDASPFSYFDGCQICLQKITITESLLNGKKEGMMCGHCLFTACSDCFKGDQRKLRTHCFVCHNHQAGEKNDVHLYQIRQKLFQEFFNLKELVPGPEQTDHDAVQVAFFYSDFKNWQNAQAEELRKKQEFQQQQEINRQKEEEEKKKHEEDAQQDALLDDFYQNPHRDQQYMRSDFGFYKTPYHKYREAKDAGLDFFEWLKRNSFYKYLVPREMHDELFGLRPAGSSTGQTNKNSDENFLTPNQPNFYNRQPYSNPNIFSLTPDPQNSNNLNSQNQFMSTDQMEFQQFQQFKQQQHQEYLRQKQLEEDEKQKKKEEAAAKDNSTETKSASRQDSKDDGGPGPQSSSLIDK